MTQELRDRISTKLSSGRFAWCVAAVLVWVYLALTGAIEAKSAEGQILLITGFYFGQRGQEVPGGGQ